MRNLPDWPYPKLVAHRGGGTLAPENTLAAMRAGFHHGFRMVEFDVKLTSDHIPVLMHDTLLERTTNGQGIASTYSFEQIACLDAGSWHSPAFSGETIPTLQAVSRFTQANGIASNIEIKPTPGAEASTATVVARQAMSDWSEAVIKPLLSSFSVSALEAAMIAAPMLPRGLIADSLPADWQALLTRLDCVSVHLKHTSVSSATVKDIHRAGFRLAVWTVNDAERAKELLSWGVDAVITDAIDLISPV